jgi:hypothetical protein
VTLHFPFCYPKPFPQCFLADADSLLSLSCRLCFLGLVILFAFFFFFSFFYELRVEITRSRRAQSVCVRLRLQVCATQPAAAAAAVPACVRVCRIIFKCVTTWGDRDDDSAAASESPTRQSGPECVIRRATVPLLR